MDRDTVVRVAALYLPVAAAAGCWLARPPGRRTLGGVILAVAWNVALLVPLQVVAGHYGWWHFVPGAGGLLPLPAELLIGWAVAWGAVPVLIGPRPRLGVVLGAALVLDLLVMPELAPVLVLGKHWLVGEAIALAICLAPGVLLGWWMSDDRRLACRAALQVLTFAVLAGVLLPALIVSITRPGPLEIDTGPSMLLPQLVLLAALPGLSAVQELVERGAGTPIPFDPPKRMVTSGIYAYVANPMQLSMALCYLVVSVMVHSWWVALAAAMSVVYAEGIARWDEDADLVERAGEQWAGYSAAVRRWRPRWKPYDAVAAGRPPARLYVDSACPECSQLGGWILARAPVGLALASACDHDGPPLERITYEPGDGTPTTSGVPAVARALEHLSLGWALFGMLARLPVLVDALQFLTDASGGAPRIRTAKQHA